VEIRNRTNFAFAPLMGRVNFPAHTATLVVKAGFRINDDGTVTPMDPPAAIEGDVTAGGAIAYSVYDADLAYYKPQADLLLNGTAYTPGGKPATTCPVTFKVGDWSKTLAAIGNRTWQKGLVRSKAGEPEPFTKVALTWANAYGGPKHDANPAGKGQKDGVLPNIEYPDDLITSTSHKPKPACFLPVHRTWAERTRKMGTYDNKWLKERWPAFPADLDWTHFNAAPEDQQLRGFLRGDEEVELVNLHPERERMKARLPGLRVRLLLRETDELKLREVQMNLDTLYVDADKLELYLTWRGIADVSNDDWDEAREVLIVSEPLIAEPATVEQLLPLFDEPEDELEETETYEVSPEEEAAKLAAFYKAFEDAEKQAAAHEAEAMKLLNKGAGGYTDPKALLATGKGKSGLSDLEAVIKKAMAFKPEAVPKHITPKSLNVMNDPDVRAAMKAFEQPSSLAPAGKTQIAAVLRSGEAQGGDFSNSDLTGENLEGADLRDVYLNDTDLSGANLKGANLSSASLLRANLAGANLEGADLTEADLTQADLSGANLKGAKLADANLDQAVAAGTDFGGADAPGAMFTRLKGEGADFTGAALAEAEFSDAELGGAKFEGAALKDAAFERAKAHKVVFDKAEMPGFRAETADFTDGTFKEVNANGAIFDSTILVNADFNSADLIDALFPKADMTGVRLYGADLSGAMLRRANLTKAQAGNANFLRALMEKADLTDASCIASNFYEADFLEAKTGTADFEGANLKQTKLANR